VDVAADDDAKPVRVDGLPRAVCEIYVVVRRVGGISHGAGVPVRLPSREDPVPRFWRAPHGQRHDALGRNVFLGVSASLFELQRYAEAKEFMRKTIPVARHVLGNSNDITLRMRWTYADALYKDDAATLDDLRESVAALENTEQTARRVLGGSHPLTNEIEDDLQNARAALRAREASA
jgi:hypothetical protein